MKKSNLILFFLFLVTICFGNNLRFNKITSVDGISQSEVYSFLKDKHGFMWIGTLDGLNCFDGYKITKYNVNKNNKNSLSNNTIRALVEDKFGRIWIGTDDGLNVLYPNNQNFYRIRIPKLKPSFLRINSLFIDGDFLWIGTEGGLFTAKIKYENIESIEKNIAEVLTSYRKNNTNTRINCIIKSTTGKIWIGGFGSSMCFNYNKNKNLLNQIKLPAYCESKSAKCIVEDLKGDIWLGYYDGLTRYNPETGELTSFKNSPSPNSISSNTISALAIDKDGNIWISTIDKGLNKINANDVQKKNPNFERYQNNFFDHNSLNSNLISSIYISYNNTLWIGTIGSGVNFTEIHQKKFQHYSIPPLNNETTLSTNFIRSVYLDSYNRLWIGTHNNGLFLLNRQNGKYERIGHFESQTIFDIYPIDNNTFALCTTGGVYIVNLNGNTHKIEGINANCFYITESKKDIFWIASSNGVFRLEMSGNKIINIKNYNSNSSVPKISFNNCRTIVYDNIKNELWIGTEGGGLNIMTLDKNHYAFKTSIYKKSELNNSISNNNVRSIYKQNKNIFWIGTYEGLNKVERNKQNNSLKFSSYFQKDGLPNNLIQSITGDDKNNLWIGSNGGLTKLNTVTNKISNYDISDGLQSNEFSEHTCFKTKTGEMFFGGINGVNSFFPNDIEESLIQPQITITEFYLFNEKVEPQTKINGKILLNEPIYLTKKLSLKPIQNDIRFDFSAMIFTSPQKVKYAYKLDGYDNKWNITDAQNRSATYTNLPYGNYTFMVKATNGDGVWKESVKRIQIHIDTPFYLTWIAFLVYILIFGLIIFYFTRYSIIKITTKKQIELDIEHTQRLHDLDMIRTRFFINISHDLRTPLTLIIGPLEQIIRSKNIPIEFNKQINVVHKNANKLKYMIEQLLDFRKNEVGKLNVILTKVDLNQFIKKELDYFDFLISEKGLELSYNFNLDKLDIYIDTDKTVKIIFNLLSNAIKFTKKGFIDISVEKSAFGESKKEFAKIEVKDTGIGIEEDKIKHVFERFYNDSKTINDSSYGIGLSHCKDLIEVLNGEITVESKIDVGSTFTVYLPIIENLEKEQIIKETSSSTSNKIADQLTDNEIPVDDIQIIKHKTILIAEDNKDMRDYIKSCLTDNYNIVEAENGADGLNLAIRKLPDLIISDIVMPIMDGITFCEKIKTTIDTSHIPVILLTARTDNEIKYRGLEMGADDYISKPFEIDYLSIKVKNLIASREHLRNLFQNNIMLEPSKVTVTSIDEKFLKSLMVEIEKGITNPEFTIEFLEKEMGMSHSKLYRKIKSITGQSGKELLQDMRLKRAAQLITDNKKISVADLTDMVGFSDPKHFSACFKQKFGVPPSEY
jgi:signal transduction histidine kinase/ligand-binding sensor domain-containing protein/DNA-binding response OmpR family regulator